MLACSQGNSRRWVTRQTTILAEVTAEGDHDPGVYNLQEIRTSIARNPVNRIMYGLWRKLAVHPANRHLYRRALVTTFRRRCGAQSGYFRDGRDSWLGPVASQDLTDSHLRPAAWSPGS